MPRSASNSSTFPVGQAEAHVPAHLSRAQPRVNATDPAGLPHFRALISSDDPDVAWIMRENSKKARLAKLL
jgi:hypothetical protein